MRDKVLVTEHAMHPAAILELSTAECEFEFCII